MSSSEKLEIFIRRMEEAEYEHEEEEEWLAFEKLDKDENVINKIESTAEIDNAELNFNDKLDSKSKVKSYSIAGLPSFYLNLIDQPNGKEDKLIKTNQQITSAQSSVIPSEDKTPKNFPQHDQIKLAFKNQMAGLQPQNKLQYLSK